MLGWAVLLGCNDAWTSTPLHDELDSFVLTSSLKPDVMGLLYLPADPWISASMSNSTTKVPHYIFSALFYRCESWLILSVLKMILKLLLL